MWIASACFEKSKGIPTIYSWSKIAFQKYLDNNYEVFVATSNGSDPQRLTFDPANEGRARLSG
jgi:hypothetical protein